MARRIGNRNNGQISGGCAVVFGMIFVIVGLPLIYFLSVVPIMRWSNAKSWVETPCEIVRSEVASHSGSKSTTYSINVQFRYDYDSQRHESNRYNFDSSSSSGYDGKAAVIARYPVGAMSVCYVDPADPTWAVLSRDWSWSYALGGIGLIFVVVGATISIGGMRGPRSAMQRNNIAPYGTLATGDLAARELSSSITPKKTLLNSALFTIAWYAILGGVGWAFLHEGLHWGNALPAAIVSVMGLAGLLGVAGVVRGFLGLWNPRVALRMDPGVLRLGGTAVFTWDLVGDVSRMDSLKIYVQGKEHATYRRGTDTTTDTSVFDKIVIAETSTQADMRTGRVEFAMPEFTMHSLDLPNNKITWDIRIEGSIPKWPDVEEEFPVVVLPLPLPDARAVKEVDHA